MSQAHDTIKAPAFDAETVPASERELHPKPGDCLVAIQREWILGSYNVDFPTFLFLATGYDLATHEAVRATRG